MASKGVDIMLKKKSIIFLLTIGAVLNGVADLMNIKGLNLKGLNIQDYKFNEAVEIEIPYEVQQHKYGANATWSHCTDTYRPNLTGKGIDAEINAFKHNLALTIFINNDASQYVDFLNTGRGRFGTYEYTGQDYYTGKLTDESYLANIESLYNNIKNGLGYYPSVASYGYGRQTFREDLKNYYLGVRNSAYDVNSYSYDIVDTSSIPTTTRQADMPGDRSVVLQESATALSNAIANSGWYTDFTHWHNCTDTMLAEYYESQRSTMGEDNVITLDFMTAMEYMKFRQNTNSIKFIEHDGKIYARADVDSNPVLNLNINTTLSVEIDLSNSILANKEIESSHGVQKIDKNIYIIEVPYEGLAVLEKDITGKYLDFNLPVINYVNKNGDTLEINTDKPTNIVLFQVPKGFDLYNATIIKRDNTMSTNHSIDVTGVDFTDVDIYIGIITKEKQSILSSKYNF